LLLILQWHPTMSCEENTRRLAADGQNDDNLGIPFDSDLIKCCPMCAVPIEKDEGCAQMMCKRCKHVFCWYCLASLDVRSFSPHSFFRFNLNFIVFYYQTGRLFTETLRQRSMQKQTRTLTCLGGVA
jgi:hypothetical protein